MKNVNNILTPGYGSRGVECYKSHSSLIFNWRQKFTVCSCYCVLLVCFDVTTGSLKYLQHPSPLMFYSQHLTLEVTKVLSICGGVCMFGVAIATSITGLFFQSQPGSPPVALAWDVTDVFSVLQLP